MITLISGTQRPASQTLRVTRIFEKLLQSEGADTQVLDLHELPPETFLPEAFAHRPTSFEDFNRPILESDGLLVVTPEYNGSFPGILKHFIDLLKFPESFENRPVAFVGLSAGRLGALRSVEQLEQIFRHRNAFIFNERVFLPAVEDQISDLDTFVDPLIQELSSKMARHFIDFCKSLKPEQIAHA